MPFAAEVARLTVASALAERNPALASTLAPNAPPALVAAAMAGVGEAAAQGAAPGQATFDELRTLAAVAPLEPEPFLVEAAIAEREGNYERAELLLKEARVRNPRSAAARYLLADVWLREDKVVDGLREMAVLTRLMPAASVQLVPALSAYAQSPGARDKLGAILADNPQLKNPLLSALAANPDNADLVVALAGPPTDNPSNDTRAWQSRLLSGLVARGEFDRAYEIWRGFAKLPPGPRPLLFNGNFRRVSAPPPFNWDYSGSSAGLAEPANGQLRVLFYARDETPLAAQLMLLSPGNYQFTAPSAGQIASGALSWRISCIGGKAVLAELPVGPGSAARRFSVPPGCPAQRVQLNGHLLESPSDSDVRIGPVLIERVGA